MTREEAIKEIKSWDFLNEKETEAIETLIPELRESEDERIRRTLVEYFGPKVQLNLVRGIPIQKIRAWLEKKKDLDKMIVVSPEVWDTAIADAYENGKKDNEKQKEQKPAEWSKEDEKTMREIDLALRKHYDERTRLRIESWLSNRSNSEEGGMKMTQDEFINALSAGVKAAWEYERKRPFAPDETEPESIRKAFISGANWQKEQNPISRTKPIVDGLTEFEKQVSYLIASVMDKEHEYSEGYVKWAAQSLMGYAIKNQKPAEWSEQDIQYYDAVMDMITNARYLPCRPRDEIVEWFKSLKNRGNFPKSNTNSPSWSEEDEREFEDLTSLLDIFQGSSNLKPGVANHYRTWLKSLRPQPRWKPSEEQMGALLNIEGDLRAFQYNDKAKIIAELYEQLKRL